MKIYYIHGFGSSVNSITRGLLENELGEPVIGLTYDVKDPAGSLEKMIAILEQNEADESIIIGASLGGWYADQLSKRCIADYVLYNPAMSPWTELRELTDDIDITANLYKYKDFSMQYVPNMSKTVFLATDDKVINHKYAAYTFKDSAEIVYIDGGHRLTQKNIGLVVDKIKTIKNQLLG